MAQFSVCVEVSGVGVWGCGGEAGGGQWPQTPLLLQHAHGRLLATHY